MEKLYKFLSKIPFIGLFFLCVLALLFRELYFVIYPDAFFSMYASSLGIDSSLGANGAIYVIIGYTVFALVIWLIITVVQNALLRTWALHPAKKAEFVNFCMGGYTIFCAIMGVINLLLFAVPDAYPFLNVLTMIAFVVVMNYMYEKIIRHALDPAKQADAYCQINNVYCIIAAVIAGLDMIGITELSDVDLLATLIQLGAVLAYVLISQTWYRKKLTLRQTEAKEHVQIRITVPPNDDFGGPTPPQPPVFKDYGF